HIGEGGSCDPCYPLDQPPTSDPQPVVLADTGTDARENIGSSPHRINCLAPLLTGLSKGVRDMRVLSSSSRRRSRSEGWPVGAGRFPGRDGAFGSGIPPLLSRLVGAGPRVPT